MLEQALLDSIRVLPLNPKLLSLELEFLFPVWVKEYALVVNPRLWVRQAVAHSTVPTNDYNIFVLWVGHRHLRGIISRRVFKFHVL